MVYDFDTPVVRRGTGCYKWDEAAYDDLIPLWVADMDFATAPAIVEALRKRVEHGVFGYTLVPPSYYEAIQSWFRRRHGWTIERDWIQYTSGVVPALSVLVKAFTQPGDKVIVQTPVYNCFFSSIRNNGCEVLENSLLCEVGDTLRYTIDFADLEQKARDPRAKMLILCNPHNPAGRVWTREELLRIDRICKENDVMVVSDEIHNELTYGGRRYVPYGTVSQMEGCVVCTSPSKSFNTAGLQIANIVCKDPSWRQRIDRAINQNEVCDVNPFGVVALQAAYNEGEPWLDELCSYIHQNYLALCRFLAAELPTLKVAPLEGTYLVWIDIRALGVSSDELARRFLQDAHVQVNSGTMYGHRDGEGFIRLNIACPRSQLMEGLRRMAEVIASPGR